MNKLIRSIELFGLMSGVACSEDRRADYQAMVLNQDQPFAPQKRTSTHSSKPQMISRELARLIEERRKACGGAVGENFGDTFTADFNADGKTDNVFFQETFLCADEPAGRETWGMAGPNSSF